MDVGSTNTGTLSLSPSSDDDLLVSLLKGRQPLDSQRAALSVLAHSGRALAVLPTGSGKTLLAALPFLAGKLIPRQMLFCTPLRSLTSAQAHTLRADIDLDVASQVLGVTLDIREQTGTVPEDPMFLAPIVVTTFDQALSSALGIAYSTSSRRRNINAGAILGSYIVADEIHLYPRDAALTTLLWLLRCRPDLPFLLMTATLTRDLAGEVANLLRAELLAPMTPKDQTRLGIDARARWVEWLPQPIEVDDIRRAAESGDGSVLVVVNTVDRAIAIGRKADQTLEGREVKVLHSRFYSEHRSAIECDVRTALGRDATHRRPMIVIATQVVEAGLDISADWLLTELAPANSLIQRWGRCARWGGTGHVQVFPTETNVVYPYADDELSPIVDRTRAWLEGHAREHILADDATERDLLETAHGDSDRRWLKNLRQAICGRETRVGEVAGRGEYTAAGELIRNVTSRTLLVHGEPEAIQLPTHCRGFGVSLGALFRLLGTEPPPGSEEDEEPISLDLPGQPGFVLKIPVWDDGERGEKYGDEPVRWQPATAKSLPISPIVAVNPEFVRYDPNLGLEFGAGAAVSRLYWANEENKKPLRPQYSAYRRETHVQHAERMRSVYEANVVLGPRLEAIAERIEDWCGWPPRMLRRVVLAAIALHDVGKLALVWQQTIKNYQCAHGNPYEPWIVHSDEPPAGVKHQPWRPPPHALSGAAHALIIGLAFDGEVEAYRAAEHRSTPMVRPSAVLLSAIATHHSPSVSETTLGKEGLLGPQARRVAARLLASWGLPSVIRSPEVGVPLDERLVSFSSSGLPGPQIEMLALAFVTRTLRLADGWSQEES